MTTEAPPELKGCLGCKKLKTRGGFRCETPIAKCARKGPRDARKAMAYNDRMAASRDSAPATMATATHSGPDIDAALVLLAKAHADARRLKDRNPENPRIADIENYLGKARKLLEGK